MNPNTRGFTFPGLVMAAALLSGTSGATTTAIRISDMDLRDPHLFVNALGCRDLTDNTLNGYSFNNQLQNDIQTDGHSDGYLDLSYILLFENLNPTGSGGALRFGNVDCTAPMASTHCVPGAPALYTLTSTQSTTSTCLALIAGTVRPYSPAVGSSTTPCFVSNAFDLSMNIGGGLTVPLRSAQVAGRFVGTSPVTGISNGLIRGFLTQADANSTFFPASYPLVGGKAISVVLPGGDPVGPDVCCAAHSDKDTGGPGGASGWWMYFNFTGQVVPWSEPSTSVGSEGVDALRFAATPNPASGSVELSFTLASPEDVRVSVHDLLGRRVADLASGRREAGSHRVTWNGLDASGARVAPGIYALTLRSGDRTIQKRVALVH